MIRSAAKRDTASGEGRVISRLLDWISRVRKERKGGNFTWLTALAVLAGWLAVVWFGFLGVCLD